MSRYIVIGQFVSSCRQGAVVRCVFGPRPPSVVGVEGVTLPTGWAHVLKPSSLGAAMDQRQHAAFSWDYDRGEIIADGMIHALGICLGLIGAVSMIVLASVSTRMVAITSVSIYAAGLVAMLGLSAAYNMWPISPTKWILRRFDHSAIYLLIAGTYTPFIAHLKNTVVTGGLLAGVWLTASIGIVLKLALPGRFD